MRFLAKKKTPMRDSMIYLTLRAAQIDLQTDGWGQGRGLHEGKRCLTSVIGSAAIDLTKGDGWWELARDVTAELHPFIGHEVVKWNDQPGRTQAEVLEVLGFARQAVGDRIRAKEAADRGAA